MEPPSLEWNSEEQRRDTEFYEISICQLYVFFMIKCTPDIENQTTLEDMIETEGVPPEHEE